MTVINIDLEDGFEPVSFTLKANDTDRFIEFMAEQNGKGASITELENALNEAADVLDGCRYSEIPAMKKARAIANNKGEAP